MQRRRWIAVLALVASVGGGVGYLAGKARAVGIPASKPMTYSGVLTDPAGTPLTGMKNIQVQLWDMAMDGTMQCSTGPTAITLVAGSFQLPLLDACTAVVQALPDLWAEVFVDGSSLGRTKLGAVPFAVEAARAATVACPSGMADSDAGFCIDGADRTETAYGSSFTTCAGEGKLVCTFSQLCTAKLRNVGSLGTANYRVADIMLFRGDDKAYYGAGTGANGLVPGGCTGISAPGPYSAGTTFRCCRDKG